MSNLIRLVGENQTVEILGVKLLGVNAENGKKILFSAIFIAVVLLLGFLLKKGTALFSKGDQKKRIGFWTAQVVRVSMAVLLIIGLVSIWFSDPSRLATALGLVTAGLAFALQKVVTAIAGYFVILRGKTFHVGDRITMGGVRGDVIAMGFIRTTIMEMGQPPPVQSDEPAMWVQGRQYTGCIVTVTNDKIFDEPVYNYTLDFPYIWEEISVPITYQADRARAEQILLESAKRHTVQISELSQGVLKEMERRYLMKPSEMSPKVYYQLTGNYLKLTVRFIAKDYGTRELKNEMSRDILTSLHQVALPKDLER